MPFATSGGVRIHWERDGTADRPEIVLLNSIGTDMSLWSEALPGLRPHFSIVRIDTRGHGASETPAGDYTLPMLASDVAAVMDAAGCRRAAIAGVSLGGMIAMELALAAPDRVAALVLVCTSAAMDRAVWSERVRQVRAGGTAAIAEAAIGRFLTPEFAAARPDIAARLRTGLVCMPADGYAGCGAAIRDMALIDRIGAIAAPNLVVTGTRDVSTPYAGHGDSLVARIPGARHLELEAAHLAPLEVPAALTEAMRAFIAA